MMDILPQNRFHMLLRGHVLDRLKELPDESVDCIMTSPPYYGLRMYRGAESQWGDWHGQLGLEPDFRMYLDHLLMVTGELKRVLKKSGTLWWNMGDSYAGSGNGHGDTTLTSNPRRKKVAESALDVPKRINENIPTKSLMLMPERLALRMVDEQGWILRNMNIWHKPNHMPSSVKDRLSNSYEFVMLFTKAQRYFFDLDAIRVPLSPVTLKEIEKEYNGTSLKDYGGAMAQDASESKKRIIDSLRRTKIVAEDAENMGSSRARYYRSDKQSNVTDADGLLHRQYNGFNDRWNNGGKMNINVANPGDVLKLATQPHPFAHFAVYPVKLCIMPIKAGCPKDGVVLDPFAGSGTTGVATQQLGRSSILIEISDEYCDIIKQRMEWGQQTLDSMEWIEK